LYGQVAQAADAEDREPLAWLDIGVLQRAIDRDSRAEKWRSVDRGKPIRNLQGMTSGSFHEFSVAAIHGYAGDLLFNAEVLISLATELTFSTGPVNPRNANVVSEFQVIDGCAFFHDATCDFVPEDQWFLGDGNDLRPIALGHVQIRMADAASLHCDQHFMCVGLGPSDFFDSQRLFEFVQDGGLHRVYLEKVGMRNSFLSE
jgi:hypothetical protein